MQKSQIEILLVEDHKNDAELTLRALRKGNIINNIIHLKDGVEAIDFLYGINEYKGRNIKIQPKLILLDLKMPRLNGMELLERLKTDTVTKQIPVVILTSSKENPDIKKCYELGANSYIVKPVEFGNFAKTVADIGLYWAVLNQPPVI